VTVLLIGVSVYVTGRLVVAVAPVLVVGCVVASISVVVWLAVRRRKW